MSRETMPVNITLPLKLDAFTVAHCEEAVQLTFHSLFGIQPRLLRIDLKNLGVGDHDISGVIGFAQNKMEGVLILGCKKETLLPLIAHFYGEEITELNHKAVDSVGEITNIIFGVVKEKYNRLGYKFEMCLPTVTLGSITPETTCVSGQRLTLIFAIQSGEFSVEMRLMAAEVAA